jgi:hypothetical protein
VIWCSLTVYINEGDDAAIGNRWSCQLHVPEECPVVSMSASRPGRVPCSVHVSFMSRKNGYLNHAAVNNPLKADSHIACRAHAVPLPCRAAKGLEYVFSIWFTQCDRVWFIKMWSVNQTRPHCVNQMGKTHSKTLAARHGRGTEWARHAMCESAFKTAVFLRPEVCVAKPNSDWPCRAGVGIGRSTASSAFSWTGYLLYNHTEQRVKLSAGNKLIQAVFIKFNLLKPTDYVRHRQV